MAHDPCVSRVVAAVAWGVVVASFVAVGGAAAAGEASITRTGWWTRNPAASAPDGGLDVGWGPDGQPLSVAAIEVAAAGDVTRAVLTVDEAGGVQQAGAAVVVCATASPWRAGPHQAMADAPAAACDAGKVGMTRNAASASWAADVTPLLAGMATKGAVSLTIVPTASDGAPLGFDVQFSAPRLQSEVGTVPSTTTTTASNSSSASASGGSSASSPPATTGADGYEPAVAARSRSSVDDAPAPMHEPGPADAALAASAAPVEPVPPPPSFVVERARQPPPQVRRGTVEVGRPWLQLAIAALAADLVALALAVGDRRPQRYRAPTGT
jgi:hypothetical protein